MEAAETAEAADLEGEAAEPLREGEAVDPPTLECNRSTHYRNLLYREGASRPTAYPVPFITSPRDGSNFPGEKMSALLLSIPQWDSIYTC